MAIDNNNFARRWMNADVLLLSAVRELKAHEGLMAVLTLEHQCELSLDAKAVRRLAPFGIGDQGTSLSAASPVTAGLPVEQQEVVFGATGIVEASGAVRPASAVRPANAERKTYKSIVSDPRTNKGGTGGIPPRGRPDRSG